MWSRGRKLFWNQAHTFLIGSCQGIPPSGASHLSTPSPSQSLGEWFPGNKGSPEWWTGKLSGVQKVPSW